MTISKPKYQILLLLFFITFSCQKQLECNPKEFETGKFEFIQEVNGTKEITTFERTDKLQIETYKGLTDKIGRAHV